MASPSGSFSLPSHSHPTPSTHRLPSIHSLASNYRRASALDIPPFRPPSEGGPPRRLSTGGFPSVFALPGAEPVEGLGIRGADDDSAPAPPASAQSSTRKRRSDPQGYATDELPPIKREPSTSSISPNSGESPRNSPNSSKRPRTAGPSLDSLASAASSILSASASASLAPPASPYAHAQSSPIGLNFTDVRQAEQVQLAMGMREQQMREIERRRGVHSSGVSSAPGSSGGGGGSGGAGGNGVAGLNNALGKLRAGKEKAAAQSQSPRGEGEKEGTLGKRRGGDAREKTRNLTVVTGYGGEAAQGAMRSAPANVNVSQPHVAARDRVGGGAPPPQTAYPTYREQPRDAPPPSSLSRRRPSASGPSTSHQQQPYPSVTQPYTPSSTSAAPSNGQRHPHSRYPPHQLPAQPQQPNGRERSPPPPGTAHQYAFPAQYLYPSTSANSTGGGGPLSPLPRQPPTASTSVHSPPNSASASSKTAFLSLFSTFYDSLSDSRILSRTLESQIHKSTALLTTLQDSGRVFEELLEARVGKVARDQARETELIERRLKRLEGRVGGRREEEEESEEERESEGEGEDRGSPVKKVKVPQESVWERLERLEKLLAARGIEADPPTAAEGRSEAAQG